MSECPASWGFAHRCRPQRDDPGEGPCGYTYLTSSPEDDAYQLTVAATRTITYRSSAGNGTRNSLDRTLTVDYDVDEIQTIGISN